MTYGIRKTFMTLGASPCAACEACLKSRKDSVAETVQMDEVLEVLKAQSPVSEPGVANTPHEDVD